MHSNESNQRQFSTNDLLHLHTECDVLVVGGDTAGTVAAIQAARLGAKTVIIEMTSQLGGTITNCGVCAPFHFFRDGRQVISGIGWDLVSSTKELGKQHSAIVPGDA